MNAFDQMMGNPMEAIEDLQEEAEKLKKPSLLEKYAKLKQQAKEIDAQLKELEPVVLNEIVALDGMKLEADYGTFSVMAKDVYTYTVELQMEEARYKAMLKLKKAEQEKDGRAEKTGVKSILRYQSKK